MGSTELSIAKKIDPQPITLSVPRPERVLASAAYLSALGGFWLIVPAALYLWRGKTSRFIGFHAVQAVMLQVALIPIGAIAIGACMGLMILLDGVGHAASALGIVLAYLVLGLAVMLPAAITLWMGLCALRGQPKSLPLLGRWARRVVGDDL
ncbi:hypothetical protein A7982_12989 [Minicystis rosea]|nr:hypothetical protein A7982_12989 [Minicystis rosea]